MIDLAVIILTKDEKLHIVRCLDKLRPLVPRQVFVVDCFSTDGTQDLVRDIIPIFSTYGGELHLVEHEWPGNQAEQFNWALDHLPINASWILRLDADEYIYQETIDEVKGMLPHWDKGNMTVGNLPADVTALSLSRVRTFWQEPVRYGVGKIILTRFFKRGYGRSDQRIMDERIVTTSGQNIILRGKFVDDNLSGLDWWTKKHLDYAKREAMAMTAGDMVGKKSFYSRLPLFWRALAYFLYRYILRGGFLDGKAGFQWHFFQGLWYRMLVDAKLLEMKRSVNDVKDAIPKND